MALQSFQKVLDLENGEKGEWGFKALKQMIKINFKLSNYKEMMYRYKQLLTYIKSAVTRNHSEKSINSILDYISTSKNVIFVFNFFFKFWMNGRLWCDDPSIRCRVFRWNYCKTSTRPHWMRWRMRKTIGSGLKRTRNWGNCISIGAILLSYRKFSSNFINPVRYVERIFHVTCPFHQSENTEQLGCKVWTSWTIHNSAYVTPSSSFNFSRTVDVSPLSSFLNLLLL